MADVRDILELEQLGPAELTKDAFMGTKKRTTLEK